MGALNLTFVVYFLRWIDLWHSSSVIAHLDKLYTIQLKFTSVVLIKVRLKLQKFSLQFRCFVRYTRQWLFTSPAYAGYLRDVVGTFLFISAGRFYCFVFIILTVWQMSHISSNKWHAAITVMPSKCLVGLVANLPILTKASRKIRSHCTILDVLKQLFRHCRN